MRLCPGRRGLIPDWKQDFARVDVSDASDHLAVHDQLFDGHLAARDTRHR